MMRVEELKNLIEKQKQYNEDLMQLISELYVDPENIDYVVLDMIVRYTKVLAQARTELVKKIINSHPNKQLKYKPNRLRIIEQEIHTKARSNQIIIDANKYIRKNMEKVQANLDEI